MTPVLANFRRLASLEATPRRRVTARTWGHFESCANVHALFRSATKPILRELIMLKRILAAAALAAIIAAPQFVANEADAASGVNIGSLNCNVSGGVGFVFGSSKDISCVFTKPDGTAERYHGEINKYGVDIGFTAEGYMVWAVFAPGQVAKGALAGKYGGATADVAAGLGLGANVLVGGSGSQIALQPVSIEGMTGLNVAAGFGQITLQAGK